jgi:hypothetical protein
MANEEQIGFHKGCLDTLMKERQELVKMVAVTEQLMAFHVSGLKNLGVDLQKEMEKAKKEASDKKELEKKL